MPNLRGREVPNDHGRGREVLEAEGGFAEESETGRKGSSREKETKLAKHGGDEAIKGEKIEDELETPNSDESENRSDEAESVRMFDSDTPEGQAEEKATGEAPAPLS